MGLPDPLVKAIEYDGHVLRGDISVTSLIDAPRIRVLKKLLLDREEDASSRMWMLWGSAVHYILQKSDPTAMQAEAFNEVIKVMRAKGVDNPQFLSAADWLSSQRDNLIDFDSGRYIVERTFTAEVETELGIWIISGTVDLYDKETKMIQDYKLCSTYKWTQPESQAQWIRQLNVYKWLLEQNGYEVKGIQIVAMYRNWSANSYVYARQKMKDYPESSVSVITLPTSNPDWTEEERKRRVDQWIKKMVLEHQKAEMGDVRDCDGKERWAAADCWKVYKKDGLRALSVQDTEIDAKVWLDQNKHKSPPGTEFEIRRIEGESRRCEQYCPVFKECPQVAKHRLAKKNNLDRMVADVSEMSNSFEER
jgi:hypothetical protein